MSSAEPVPENQAAENPSTDGQPSGNETPGKKSSAKKSAAKKPAAKKSPTKTASTKTAAKKSPTKKVVAKRAVKRPVKRPVERPVDDPVARPTILPAVERDDVVDPAPAAATSDVTGEFWGEEKVRSGEGGAGRSRRGRRAMRRHHILRNISVWSVLKVSVVFYLCVWIVLLISGVVLWQMSEQAGLVGNVESFWAEATGQETVEWDGSVLFRSWLMAGSVLALAAAALTTLFAALFNLICDLTGGIRYTVLEVEQVERGPRRTFRGRR